MTYYSGNQRAGKHLQAAIGFTLIELLVAMSVVGTLAAILVPVLSLAKGRANQVTCLNNERQMGAAALLYLADYDEVFCPPVLFAKDFTSDSTFDSLLNAYLNTGKMGGGALNAGFGAANPLFTCPSDNTQRHPWVSHPHAARRSYSMIAVDTTSDPAFAARRGIGAWPNIPFGGTEASLPMVENPAGTLLLGECHSGWNITNFWYNVWIVSPFTQEHMIWDTTLDYPIVHSGGSNYLFADGHARWLRPAQTIGHCPDDEPPATIDHPCGMWTLRADD